MCGILFYYSNNKIPYQLFKEALDLQSHRGPDNTGIFINTLENNEQKNFFIEELNQLIKKKNKIDSNLFIGHKRLSVFDLTSRSNQPFVKNNKDFFIYNGEFYNYKSYASNENINSDALTLYDCINKYGINFYNEVNGMWASVHSDFKNKRVFLSRDRYGKKPLYYYLKNKTFIASSEIKSIFHILKIKRKIEIKNLAYFFSYKVSPFFTTGETFYSEIKSILPGTVSLFNIEDGTIENILKVKHIDQSFKKSFYLDENKVKNQFKVDIKDSVDLRLKTDRKAALLISGGVDSSFIASQVDRTDMPNLNFYNIFNADNSSNDDDLFFSRKVSDYLGIKLKEIPLSYNFNKFDQIFDKLTRQQEVPVNFSATAIPTFYVSEQMKQDNIHVALDGVGGDEIMGGFPVFTSLAIASLKANKFLRTLLYYYQFYKYENVNVINKIKVLLYILYKGFVNKKSLLPYQKNSFSLLKNFKNKLLKNCIESLTLNYKREKLYDQFDRQIYEIEHGGLPYYLGVSDSSNMINTVESRSPFLDTRINKYLYMPDHLKFKNGYNKYLLRKVLSSKLPGEIAWRKNKQGFTTYGADNYIFEKKSLEKIFDSSLIRQLLKENISIHEIKKNKYALRHLIPIANLDHIYGLEI